MDVKLKMALWYTALATVAALVIGLFLLAGARRVTAGYYEETLASVARLAREEVEYEGGELQIDDDLKDVPDAHISLYTQGGTLIYGRARFSLPFEEGAVRTERTDGVTWYLLDTLMRFDWRGDVWMRCAMRADAEDAIFAPVLRLALVLLPLMILLTGAGGYQIALRAFRPVERMARTAEEIAGGGDLGKRVALAPGARDELGALARTLDAMLERLEGAFCRERRFTSDAAHELRTPLNALRLLCEDALSRPDKPDMDPLIEEMLERIDGLSSLVAQLLTLSRMDADRMELHRKETDLSALLAGAAAELAPVAEDAGVTLETEIEPNVTMLCDGPLMTRLVANLLDNAIRYGRRGGFARLTLKRDGGDILLCVCDNGAGIRPEELTHIWERFWRADASRNSPGTGLGLSISKWIIERHGGRADVESAPGKGTKISIRFH